IGRGRIFVGNAEAALARSDVVREPMSDHAGVFFLRRSFDGGWNYFIANRKGDALDDWVTVGRSGQSAELMDPMTGEIGMAAIRNLDGQTQVYLQLQPGDSIILRLFKDNVAGGPAWNYWQTNGPAMAITGTWNVNFVQGGPELPAPFTTTQLASWTDQADANAQRFAGSALYTINFDAPTAADPTYILDLGNVCQSARVRLNGKDYGTLMTPPFRVAVDNLKPHDNKLEVEVTNVSANRIRDLDRRHVHWKIFGDIGIVDSDYNHFDASDWPLADSGLMGPVTLTVVEALKR
ncbi:MAG TPA: glycoside hydrolase family 2, partial [Verrucomicrobiae bacterium]|nr:glycoside hydrolase family 2 [Verrucomicrobiae bacterium]